MISKVAAGGGAAALTAFAIGVSLRHGIFVAALAFVGGFASPAIIGSETPNTPVLFGYLLAIAAGTLGVIRIAAGGRSAGACSRARRSGRCVWMLSPREAGELHWVGLFLVAVAGLFVWATWRRMGESENPPADVAALVWAALGRHRRAAGGRHRPGRAASRTPAGWRWRLHGAGPLRARPLDAALPVCRGAGAGPVDARRSPCGGATTRGAGAGWDADRFAWLTILFGGFYAAGAFALLWNAGAAGLLGGALRRRRARAFPALLVRAAQRRDRHAVGPDQHRPRRAVPGRRRAAGALARNA